MQFPLSRFPLELALEVLRLAAFPEADHHHLQIYKTASSRFSFTCHSSNCDATSSPYRHSQHFNNKNKSKTLDPLSLNYSYHIRRLWSTQSWEPLVHQSTHRTNYNTLYPIFASTESIGFNLDSLHLLYEVLGGPYSDSLLHWQCQRVTFAGTSPRWNPITSTTAGLSVLRQLTHLTVWIPNDAADGSASDPKPHLIPDWVQKFPLELMPNLIRFAFSLVYSPGSSVATILTYALPTATSPGQNSIFRSWAISAELLSYGVITNVRMTGISAPSTQVWEMTYLRGDT